MKSLVFAFLTILLAGNRGFSQAGILDNTFGNNGVVYCETDYAKSPFYLEQAQDAQQRILTLSAIDDDSSLLLVRNLPDGSLDIAFGNNGKVFLKEGLIINDMPEFYPFLIVVQPDNGILVSMSVYDAESSHAIIMRFLEGGSLDAAFGNQGLLELTDLPNSAIFGMTLQTDGKILVSSSVEGDVLLMRFFTDGSIDSSFGTAGRAITDLMPSGWDADKGGAMVVQPDGKIVMAAINAHGGPWSSGVRNFALIRYEASGRLDTSFADFGIAIDSTFPLPVSNAIILTDDHSILIGGRMGDVFYGGYYLTLRKYTSSGMVDASFADKGIYISSGCLNGANIRSLQMQSDQKILAGGSWSDTIRYSLVMRFTQEGKPDPTFALEGRALLTFDGYSFAGNKVYLNPDGKILLLGSALNLNEWTARVFVARYINDISTAIPEASNGEEFSFKLYPNPVVSNQVIMDYELLYTEKVTALLVDMKGKVMDVLLNQEQRFGGKNSDLFNLPSTIASGVYMIRLETSTGKKGNTLLFLVSPN
jgi:uncharacterized delta-60 repeat protein